ncbi:MAG: beta-3-deoxy-D-manno-oct-2-ulosonic acid transferase [Idiomarina sp.]|uniref:capsular polysaccharide export protein, LipB/KpsS family n=1 Tax=Idiomarina sp. TaxID=1874361 RepID=UPI000C513A47|nr:hypothetical protein [Idiomarina sp.]MBT42220.1 beta-3-deoxy-D-manno-oct-2-ulosonic acid transferase [Idiomarina sp.]
MTINIDSITQRQGRVYIVGVNVLWKRAWQAFFSHLNPQYVSYPSDVPSGALALVWGYKYQQSDFSKNVRIVRVEDGFIRSVGLGVEFAKPCSWVIDDKGLYFDASQPSRLESWLNGAELNALQTQRANALIEKLVTQRISKYNSQTQSWCRPKTDKTVILVPGQVETDKSILLGSPAITTNLGLLEQVRRNNPEAFVVYKPHPDIVAKARKYDKNELKKAQAYCDEVIINADIIEVLENIDEVHTLTSLTGFEGLLRGKSVACYGQPFYSGWGLTNDYLTCQRRGKHLNLATLVYGALIAYPLYCHPRTGEKTDVEDVVDALARIKNKPITPKYHVKNLIGRGLRQLINRMVGRQ